MKTQSVLLRDPLQFDAAKLGQFLSTWRKIPATDAIRLARLNWGLVAESLDPSEAEDLEERLGAQGWSALRVDQSMFIEPPKEQPVESVRNSSHALVLKSLGEQEIPLSGPTIAFIGAAEFELDHSRKVTVKEGPSAAQRLASTGILLATGLPIRVGPQSKSVEKTQHNVEHVLLLDLGVKAAEGVKRYRIIGTTLDYTFLGERKAYNAFGNFKLLVGEIAARSTAAILNRGSRALTRGGPTSELRYLSSADFERETRWLWNLAPH